MQISKSAAIILAVLVAAFIFAAPRLGFYGFATLDPPMGAKCNVQIRREMLGVATNLPVSPNTSSIDGAETCVSGTLKSVSRDWVVVEVNGKDAWIARHCVLLIQTL